MMPSRARYCQALIASLGWIAPVFFTCDLSAQVPAIQTSDDRISLNGGTIVEDNDLGVWDDPNIHREVDLASLDLDQCQCGSQGGSNRPLLILVCRGDTNTDDGLCVRWSSARNSGSEPG